jgi:short-subunit dehydrogenase
MLSLSTISPPPPPPIHIHGLIERGGDSCTGYGIIGATEDQDECDIRAQFETNVVGMINIFQATTPYFREKGKGRFIVFSSLHGVMSVPGLGRMLPPYYPPFQPDC